MNLKELKEVINSIPDKYNNKNVMISTACECDYISQVGYNSEHSFKVDEIESDDLVDDIVIIGTEYCD